MPSVDTDVSARNDQVDWNSFDSDTYCETHYGRLREDDRQIAIEIREFFADYANSCPGKIRRAVDVGTGANLYPALAMLPFANTIDLYERSISNVSWLHRQRKQGFGANWDLFWNVYRDNAAFARYANRIPDIRSNFRGKTDVKMANVFKLPVRRWDMGTMFFVACSISSQHSEFVQATQSFVRSLRREAPFAIAFMTNSRGYDVGAGRFPAVPVSPVDIENALGPVVDRSRLNLTIITTADPVRSEVGMLLATGFAA